VCADDIRERMTKWRRDDSVATWKYVEPVKREVQLAISRALRERLDAGQPTVYDNTNVRKRNRETLLQRLLDQGAFVRALRGARSPAGSEARRPRLAAESMIRDQHGLFLDELPAILAGDGRPYVTVEDLRSGHEGLKVRHEAQE
jgi:predicted kinase